MTEIDAKRAQALAWIAEYVPADQGQSAYAEINADWTGGGTTCGFLAHWLLAAGGLPIGCTLLAPVAVVAPSLPCDPRRMIMPMTMIIRRGSREKGGGEEGSARATDVNMRHTRRAAPARGRPNTVNLSVS